MAVPIKTLKQGQMYKVHLLPQYLHYINILHVKMFSMTSLLHTCKYVNIICNTFQDIQLLDFPIHTHCTDPSKGDRCKQHTERAELTYRLEIKELITVPRSPNTRGLTDPLRPRGPSLRPP